MADADQARIDRRTTDTRARILEVALELFATKGFAATSLRDIAEALDITKAALYYHFPAKADLAGAVVQPFFDDIDVFMTRAADTGWSRRRVLEAFVDAIAPNLVVLAAMVRDASLLAHVDLEETAVRWLDGLPELLVGDDPSSAERIQAIVAVGGLGRAMTLPDVRLDDIRTVGIDAALRAFAPPTTEAPAVGDRQ